MNTLYKNKDIIFDIKRKVENKDKSLYSHYIIDNNHNIDDETITIVMTSRNRSKQVYFTIKTIANSTFKNVQLILVDDSSHDEVDYEILKNNNYSFYIDYIKINQTNKNWHNPLVNYNIGFQYIKGKKIIIQNSEVSHIGDILKFIDNKLKNNDEYFVFDVKASKNYETNEEIYKYDMNDINIYNENFYIDWYNGWYQSEGNNRNLHFLVSLNIETFNKIRHFSYDYTMGSCFDDDDFLLSIKANNINIINIFHRYHNIGGVHLFHGVSTEVWDHSVEYNEKLFNTKQQMYETTKKYIDVTKSKENFEIEYFKLNSNNMEKKTIVTITGIRPDFIRMCAVFKELDKYFNHVLIHTGQHYDNLLSDVFFKQLDIRDPDYILNTGKSSSNHYEQLAYLSVEIPKLFQEKNINPDLILFLGDSNSAGVSFPLKKAGYKIGHIEAGMRSYDKRMLEEINRTVCDHCSDILFVYHDDYKEQLQKENITKNVFVVGNTVVEPFKMFSNDIIHTPKRKDMILLDIHRPENFKYTHRLVNIFKFANDCIEKYNIPVKMLYFKRLQDEIDKHSLDLGKIVQVPLFPYKEYLETVYHCRFIISDSGTGQEEPALLDTPVIVPRDYTERPQSFENNCSIQLCVEKEEFVNKYDIFMWIDSLEKNIIQMNTSWLGKGETSQLIVNEIIRFTHIKEAIIPKIFFTYWEGEQLSYLHYFTIYSFIKLNPNTEVIIYTSKIDSAKLKEWDGDEHSTNIVIDKCVRMDKILEISNMIKLKYIDFEKEYKIYNNISCVYKADFTRIAKLYEHGGMWFDFDILFINPVPNYIFQHDFTHNLLYFRYGNTIPTGLIFSSPKNETITILYNNARNKIQNLNKNYQQIGPDLWNNVIAQKNKTTGCLCASEKMVYPYLWNDTYDIFYSLNDKTTEETFGIHWYNGDNLTKKYINEFDINNIDPNKNIFEKYLFKIMNL